MFKQSLMMRTLVTHTCIVGRRAISGTSQADGSYEFDPSQLFTGGYGLTVTVTDSGVPELTGTATFSFVIASSVSSDANDDDDSSGSMVLALYFYYG